MRFRAIAAFLITLVLIVQPEANADDIGDGRDIFIMRCLGCHAFACNREGPRLGGLFGRKVATAEDYKFYSEGLKNSEIVWTSETLDNFFSDPGKIFPESEMAVQGKIEDAAQRRKLIAFLDTEDPTVNLCPQ